MVTRWVCVKVAQNVAQSICLSKLMHSSYRRKSSPEMCFASIIFKPRLKVNNHPLGEFSHNLVTLFLSFEYLFRYSFSVKPSNRPRFAPEWSNKRFFRHILSVMACKLWLCLVTEQMPT
jgi:hypothetical protein